MASSSEMALDTSLLCSWGVGVLGTTWHCPHNPSVWSWWQRGPHLLHQARCLETIVGCVLAFLSLSKTQPQTSAVTLPSSAAVFKFYLLFWGKILPLFNLLYIRPLWKRREVIFSRALCLAESRLLAWKGIFKIIFSLSHPRDSPLFLEFQHFMGKIIFWFIRFYPSP